MRQKIQDVTIYDVSTLPESTFTVVAATDVFTSGAAHGFKEGDKLQFTTANTLPAGLSLATNYYVISIPSTTTFKISATRGGSSVDATDTGTGVHTYHLKGRMILVEDFKNIKIAVNFTTTPTMTVKFQGSNQREDIDCSLAQSETNRWDYVEITDAEDEASIDGDTGVACAGSVDNRIFNINDNAYNYVSCDITSWTAGRVSVILSAYSD